MGGEGGYADIRVNMRGEFVQVKQHDTTDRWLRHYFVGGTWCKTRERYTRETAKTNRMGNDFRRKVDGSRQHDCGLARPGVNGWGEEIGVKE